MNFPNSLLMMDVNPKGAFLIGAEADFGDFYLEHKQYFPDKHLYLYSKI